MRDTMQAVQSSAAYQGTGWQPRTGTLAEDLTAKVLWGRAGSDSEWAPLSKVTLVLPAPDWPRPSDWNMAQYLAPVSFGQLVRELTAYAIVLEEAGVEVCLHSLPAPTKGGAPLYNCMFARDQFLMTPEGAIVARMASKVRAGEERGISLILAANGVPIIATIRGDGCFEGADALWLTPRLVAIGVGNRTNTAGARQVRAVLADLGIEVRFIPLRHGVQHLLGTMQVVGPRRAVVRAAMAGPDLLALLTDTGFTVTCLPEGPEVSRAQAMNFVVTGEQQVIMAAGCLVTRRYLEQSGIAVLAQADCGELAKAGGGLACATGILHRASP